MSIIVRCPHCGTANRAGSNFCNSCGTNFLAPGKRPQREEEPGDSPTSKSVLGSQPDEQTDSPAQAPGPHAPADTSADASTADVTPADRTLIDQPWLRVEFDDDEGDAATSHDETAETAGISRLIIGVQGLLAPVRITSKVDDHAAGLPAEPATASPLDLNSDQTRRIRSLMSTAPVLLGAPPPTKTRRPGSSLRIPWIVALLSLAIGIPALLLLSWPLGTANEWPGVAEAYATIEDLPRDAFVLVYWAYDPATAGEMDLMAQPVIQHLLQRHARIAVVTLLPGGPPTARRVIRRARTAWRETADVTATLESAWEIPIRYLTGGALALPLVGQSPLLSLSSSFNANDNMFNKTVAHSPDLAVVLAANAEEVQQWLELVQPVNHSPVVAITSAGADLVLRPYWDSDQLVGLVSGYDGAYTYQGFLDKESGREGTGELDYQLVLQNWGQIAVLVVIALGNLAAILGRTTDE